MIEHSYFDSGGVRLHVASQGEGEPVVFLHGFPEFWFSWRCQMRALAEAGFRAVALDLRGYNTSDKPEDPLAYRARIVAGDVAALIESLGAPLTLVGHDWGGVIAYATAAYSPRLIRSLVVMNAPHPDHMARFTRTSLRQIARSYYIGLFQIPFLPERIIVRPSVIARMFRGMSRRPEVFDDEIIDAFVHAIQQPGAAHAALAYYRTALRHPERLPKPIRTPVEIFWGDADDALGIELTRNLEPYVTSYTVRHFPNVSHWLQQEAHEEVSAALLDHLRARAR